MSVVQVIEEASTLLGPVNPEYGSPLGNSVILSQHTSVLN